MRSVVVVVLHEAVEGLLLAAEVDLWRIHRRFAERAMHPLVAAILLGMSWLDSIRNNAELDPPRGEA
jgi:hypothetical protein